MKKTIAILLMLCLCIGLCACGKEGSAQIEYPEGWDRIAEATATLNAYYACETEDEFKAICHSSHSDSEIKMMAEGWLGFREELFMNTAGLSKIYVRKIKYIETHNGYDVFLVADGYELTDGSRTPDDPLPSVLVGRELFAVQPSVATGSLIALTIENGRYVLANDSKFQSYTETIAMCTCDLGTVLVPGDPCKSCGGAGFLAGESNDDSEDELATSNNNLVHSACLICNGDGVLEDETTCYGCLGSGEAVRVGGMVNMAEQDPCSDCEGTGLESYSYGDCSDCSGQGYKKIG